MLLFYPLLHSSRYLRHSREPQLEVELWNYPGTLATVGRQTQLGNDHTQYHYCGSLCFHVLTTQLPNADQATEPLTQNYFSWQISSPRPLKIYALCFNALTTIT